MHRNGRALVTLEWRYSLLQSFSWTEIYFGHFVQAVQILFGHLEFFRTIFQTLITKHYDWFALVNKYFRGKLCKTVWRLQKFGQSAIVLLDKNTIATLCITVPCALQKIVSDKLSKLDSKLSDIWNYFRTKSEGQRQTKSLCSGRGVFKTYESFMLLWAITVIHKWLFRSIFQSFQNDFMQL